METEVVATENIDVELLKTHLYPTNNNINISDSPSPSSRSNWMNDCCIGLASNSSVLAFSRESVVVVASRNGDERAWKVSTVDTSQQNTTDRVSSLSIIYLGKAHLSRCLCVGFQNGYLRIYNTNGVQLVSQRFHTTPILRLVPLFMSDEHQNTLEDLMVLYEGGVVVVITGLSLVGAVLLAQSHVSNSTPYSLPPTLSCRKWLLFGAELITDAVYIPPHNSVQADAFGAGRVVSVGRNPIISFYSITQEQDSPLAIAVALASTVASKLTSAVVSFAKSWWKSAPAVEESTEAQKDKTKDAAMEASVTLSVRKSLTDSQRHLYSLTAAPSSDLAVATDGFGRVLLVDMKACLIVRMWKGYRDAQCGWISDKDILYLVLHAPRRGLVEVWRMRHGARVGVHSIGSGWKLISSESRCCLLSPNGVLHNIHIK